MPLLLVLNGQSRTFPNLSSDATLDLLIADLGLLADRVAVEHNDAIVPRSHWKQVLLREGDKLEIVHFVGGGTYPG